MSKRLEEIKARVEAATPGPWTFRYNASMRHTVIESQKNTGNIGTILGGLDAECLANAQVVSNATIDLSWAVRRIERLEESLGRLIKAATTRDALREIAAALIEASTVLEEEG